MQILRCDSISIKTFSPNNLHEIIRAHEDRILGIPLVFDYAESYPRLIDKISPYPTHEISFHIRLRGRTSINPDFEKVFFALETTFHYNFDSGPNEKDTYLEMYKTSYKLTTDIFYDMMVRNKGNRLAENDAMLFQLSADKFSFIKLGAEYCPFPSFDFNQRLKVKNV